MKDQTKKSSAPDFPKVEEEIIKFWRDKKIFNKSLEQTKQGKRFVFFEGPPTANGQPGIHHVEARAFKDLIPRFKTMQGFFVERKAGWDTQGLPVELEVEKSIGVTGKLDIEKYGIDKFCKQCKESVWKYTEDWEKLTERIGFWLDMDDPYITYTNEYLESLWWIIKQAWDKKLLYQGYKVIPHCPRCGTSLSSHEVAQGYEDVTEDSVFIKFKLVDESDTYVLAWTTTPWTLPGNVALAVGKNIKYVKVKQGSEHYILAEKLLELLAGEYEMVGPVPFKDLVGKKYEPLFPFVNLEKETGKKAYYLTEADFVTTEEGTGVVHTAVMYGEDDFNLGRKIGLPEHHTVDDKGCFTELVEPWAGKFVKNVEKDITKWLKDNNKLYSIKPNTHAYPFCWRCHTPLLYYAKTTWFIKMTKLRDELIANNKRINWVPAYIKEGRFGEWLAEIKDWAVGRERYWGTPLPVWQCVKCRGQECIGSYEELKQKAVDSSNIGKDFDPHRPYIDAIKIKCDCGGEMTRVPEVMDAWFDSGSMPFAQWHYPFENKKRIDEGQSFPADFIAEAIDQTRGWFYTLLAVSTILDKGEPYKNVISLGHVLDAEGQKMSKSKGNVINPNEVIDKYGADAVRWFLYTVNQPGDSKNFDTRILEDMVKKHFIILWNVLSFYKLFATEKVKAKPGDHVLDRWIVSRLNQLIAAVTDKLEKYDVTDAARKISSFITDLSTWYIRRSRDRFKSDNSKDIEDAISTLKLVLLDLARVSAPFTPFIAEHLYQTVGGDKESVHLGKWPESKKTDQELLDGMKQVRKIVELSHSLRAEAGIKVRQPLPQVVFSGVSLTKELSEIIMAEVNVKEVHSASKIPIGHEWRSKKEEPLTVALDTTITDELKELGWVREISRNINSLRKTAGLTPQDKVELLYETSDSNLKKLMQLHARTLLKEARATSLNEGQGKHSKEVELNKQKIILSFN
ncbi:MAG: isoleucine--tRNA ligase [Patescibacteria group bacterium]